MNVSRWAVSSHRWHYVLQIHPRSKHIVEAMRAFPAHEALQFTGCEVLGLLANHYYGLEQSVFEAGAIAAGLAAC